MAFLLPEENPISIQPEHKYKHLNEFIVKNKEQLDTKAIRIKGNTGRKLLWSSNQAKSLLTLLLGYLHLQHNCIDQVQDPKSLRRPLSDEKSFLCNSKCEASLCILLVKLISKEF